MRVTIFDVAKHAGVWIITVSRIINSDDAVAAATRQRVLDTIEELGYVPNVWAQRLASGHSGLIGPVASTGFTVIEAFTPPPVGNVDIAEVRSMVEPDTVLWGGIPGAFFAPVVGDAEFESHVHAVLDVMTTQPGFVLGVADQVPPDGLYARVKRVAEIVESREMRI